MNNKRTGKFYRKNEAEVMKSLGLIPTKNSGSGWIEKEDGTYYLSDTTLAKGLTTIDDQTYYFDTEGKRQSGWGGRHL